MAPLDAEVDDQLGNDAVDPYCIAANSVFRCAPFGGVANRTATSGVTQLVLVERNKGRGSNNP